MRTFSISTSLSILLVQLGGWLLVGFLFWLLLLSHDVVAAPAAPATLHTEHITEQLTAQLTEHVASDPASGFMTRIFRGEKASQISARHRGVRHAAFWQARQTARRMSAPKRPLLALLLPRASSHQRTEAQRVAQRAPRRTHYERTHGHRSKIGQALGALFQRHAA